MYNKTNVNSKCSMRVIKGCTGRTTYGQFAPWSWRQPAPGIRPRNPSWHNGTGPLETKQKHSEDVISLKDQRAAEGAAATPSPKFEAVEEETAGPSPESTQAPKLLLSQLGLWLLREASLRNGNWESKTRRCRKCSLVQWPSWLFASHRPNPGREGDTWSSAPEVHG